MTTTTQKKAKQKITLHKDDVIVKNMRDYSNDPFVLKKAKAAQEFLTKHGLPKGF
ncbi:hypothetical protein [Chryseolinea lacunae]|uniref:Uncharacterized protein n=1 Tax=Chryseolinea lacunae TaxID=2801331 RepID=A0ABS1KWN9_9BACT|nr:hypothetical protein [Chryseolinea lacunae]MBL0742731.1 hypothetical protein [Chryseolinea lacunae]